MLDDEERIRSKAYELWVAEGRPEGRQDLHWAQAREIVALEDAGGPPTVPVTDETVEPAVAFENQGEFPGLADQGEESAGPDLSVAADTADDKPLAVDPPARRPRTRRTAAAGEGAAAPAAPKRTRAVEAADPDAPKPARRSRRPAAEPAG